MNQNKVVVDKLHCFLHERCCCIILVCIAAAVTVTAEHCIVGAIAPLRLRQPQHDTHAADTPRL